MKTQELKNGWKMLWRGEELNTSVPFSMYHDLLNHGKIEDPYYRDHAEAAMELSREDCTYRLDFDTSLEIRDCAQVWLRMEGVDTLAEIILNGEKLGETFNMHRRWEFPVKKLLKEKGNCLEVRFHSPMVYMEEQVKLHGSLPSNTDTLDGFSYLRKSSCMSGWDWAPKLPDMGLFRPVLLVGEEHERIFEVHVRQKHISLNYSRNNSSNC